MSNLSKKKRERMLQFLEELKAKNSDEEDIRAINEIEMALTEKKYGLVWEEHMEHVDEQLKVQIPVFSEDKEKTISINQNEGYNFLIEGDNLHSLYLLEKTHTGKIDVIYIDPPYNTGKKDFKYNDRYVETEDAYRHSKWISFMEKRLRVAKRLLSPTGTIYISIDDNEMPQLLLLCDEIFTPENFVANISWQRTYSLRNDSKGIASAVEHIIVYKKSAHWVPNKLARTEKMDKMYKNPDRDKQLWRSASAVAPKAETHQGMVYGIQHPFTGKVFYPSDKACWRYSQDKMLDYMNEWTEYKLEDIHDDVERAKICGIDPKDVRKDVKALMLAKPFSIAKAEAEARMESGPLPRFFFTKKGYGAICRKVYKDDTAGRVPSNLWTHEETGHTDEAKKEIKSIFGGYAPFDTPKPVRLIKRILEISSTKSSTILDFFAGSGTTGEAVLALNQSDGGTRKFILCTNNEKGICSDIAYPRLKTVITGKREDGSEFSQGLPANLLYYKTDFIPRYPEIESVRDLTMEHTPEMIQLENMQALDRLHIAILDEAEIEDVIKNATPKSTVYIASDIFINNEQLNDLEEKGCDVVMVPDHYFEFELKEVGE